MFTYMHVFRWMVCQTIITDFLWLLFVIFNIFGHIFQHIWHLYIENSTLKSMNKPHLLFNNL